MPEKKTKKIISLARNIFWPIEKSETKLFLPMALMMFCVLFNFGALRSIKDSLVVPNIGAEVISFLKLWLVMPSTVIFTIIYVRLSNIFNYEQLFYIIVSFFLGFFLFFTYVLYPGQEHYHPCQETIISMSHAHPHFKWFILVAGKWSYALMYVFCELWSAVTINLLFWQYANNIFDTKSAKRFYPILGMVGNVGLIAAGNFLVSFSDLSGVSDNNILTIYGNNINFKCEVVLKPLIKIIVLSGIFAMCLYYYIENYVLKTRNIKANFQQDKKESKTKLSFKESIKLLLTSKYIGHIVFLVLAYGLLINILEGPWKARVKELYPNDVDYLNFMGKFNICMGASSVVFMVIGSNVLRRLSWLVAALFTPFVILSTGLVFFIFVIFGKEITFFGSNFNPIYFAVIIGAAQNIISKSTKYSLFDSTKEMAYIPLSLELRTKGKAAVEVMGLKFGKAFGAFIQSFMFTIMPMATFDSVTAYLMVIFLIVMFLWFWNIVALNKEYIKIKGKENETS
ncbi:MAG: NTP/NDP exchange transporter [Rickettsiaceae bacterium]|nr:NTP/NDP exchange transporter [Rickettsiaceae bacterium]